jgi:ubiquinone/menaquinone biosynthesis C-methylase UbiE
MFKSKVTRGDGLLEGFLAEQRSKVADRLIPSIYREGRILDIGCGTYPFFLLKTKFSEKYGLDKVIPDSCIQRFQNQKITIINYDVEKKDILPFDNEFFNVVTMLAVFEHIEKKGLAKLLSEIHRILKPGGMYILTTPASWSDILIKLMAKLRLVSHAEIEEHKYVYNHSIISSMLQEANFSKEKLQFGYFEIFMNMWATATK